MKYGGWRRYLTYECPRESNSTKFLKIGNTVQIHVQLWPVGGARVLECDTWNFVNIKKGLCIMSVPNFTIFYHTVLGAALDSNGRRRCVIIIRKGRISGFATLRLGHQLLFVYKPSKEKKSTKPVDIGYIQLLALLVLLLLLHLLLYLMPLLQLAY